MASTWKVKDGTQVAYDGKLYAAGKTFSATQEEVDALGLAPYVDKTQPKKAQGPSPVKAQTSSRNKAQTSSRNKGK